MSGARLALRRRMYFWLAVFTVIFAFPRPGDAQNVAARQTTRERLGPLVVPVGANDELGVALAAQFRVNLLREHAGTERARTTTSLEVRRLRLTLRGVFLARHLQTLLQLNLTPENPELVDLWVEYAIGAHLAVRAGQTKLPFTLHRGRSFSVLPLTDWDRATNALGAERQLGMMIHDGSGSTGPLHYGAGVFAGPSARPFFGRGLADAYGESLPHRSSLRAAPVPTELHPELVARLGAGHRRMDLETVSDDVGGPLRAFGGAACTWDARPERRQDFAGRVAAELMLKFHHITIATVGYGGVASLGAGRNALAMLGATSDVMVRVHPRLDLSARYGQVDTLAALRREVRRSRTEDADSPPVRRTHEVALGATTYLVGRSLALQADATLLRDVFAGEGPREQRVRGRVQAQLLF